MDVTYVAENAVALVTAYALKAVGVVLLLIGGWVVAQWARDSVRAGLEKTKLDRARVGAYTGLQRLQAGHRARGQERAG